jgi:outer membrane protein OmpA-like peptidoglycan-associated protein
MNAKLFPKYSLLVAVAALFSGCTTPPTAVETPSAAAMPSAEAIAEANRKNALLRSLRFNEADGKWELVLPEPLLFQFDEHTLTASAEQSVRRIGESLAQAKLREIIVVGHTDNVGSRDYNEKLSLRRAQSVAAAMKLESLQNTKVLIMGIGSSSPIASNRTAEGRAENRRVAIIVEP